jgi:hypothetical protein
MNTCILFGTFPSQWPHFGVKRAFKQGLKNGANIAKAQNIHLHRCFPKCLNSDRIINHEQKFVVLKLTSPVLLRRTVAMKSATNHFWPFMTMLYGGSCFWLESDDQTVIAAFGSILTLWWNLNEVSRSPAWRISCQPLNDTSCEYQILCESGWKLQLTHFWSILSRPTKMFLY